MAFQSPRLPPPRPARSAGPVLSVGRRAYVNSRGSGMTHVPLTDEAGIVQRSSLADGTEVEIVAWRPCGASGTRYRVHARHAGIEGWLAAEQLRDSLVPPAEEPVASPQPRLAARAVDDNRRRFGQRFDPSR